MLMSCILCGCTYSLIAQSINKDTICLSQLRNIELGSLWVILVVIIAALLYRQQRLHSGANPELSQNQTPKASNETNQCLPEIEFLISRQTSKLEYAINQLKTQLSKQLQIRESLLCLCKAVEEASEAICVTDADGFTTDINKAFLQLFGYSIDEINAYGGLFTWFVIPEVGQEIYNLILNGYSWKGEVEMFVRDGKLIQVELHATAIENPASQIIGIVFIIIDLSEHKKVEASLKQGEEHLKIALQAASMATWEWDIQTREIIWSNNLENVFGFHLEAFSHNFDILLKYVYPDDHQKLTFVFNYACDEQVDYKIEFRLLQTDGSIRWLEAQGQILYNKTGLATRMLGTVLDITKRKKPKSYSKPDK